MTLDPRELPSDVDALKALIIAQRQTIFDLEHNNRILRGMVFGPKSERAVVQPLQQGQLLFAEISEAAARVAQTAAAKATTTAVSTGSIRPAHGRRKEFPEHLPRFRTLYELKADQRLCACGAELVEMSTEERKEIERLEVSVIHEIARKKYCCRNCQEQVVVAPGPACVIDKGILGVGFIAHVISERFLHHMPYYRQEKKYAREGLAVSRAVMCRTATIAAELLAPIAKSVFDTVLEQPLIFTDDTPVVIAESSIGGRKEGRVWVYADNQGRCAFDFSNSREAARPCELLANYKGHIHADAYKGYDQLFVEGSGRIEVACWAHARRYFKRAVAEEPKLAEEARERIAQIYVIERAAKDAGLDPPALRTLRQEKTRAVIDDLFDWMTVVRGKVLDKGKLAQAIAYCMHQRVALTRFVDDGRLEPDNNRAERALRPIAIGRKNWLFFQQETGGETAAVLYTLVRTCHEIGIDPREYLRDVLLRIGSESDVAKLTPHGWKQHFQADSLARKQRVLDQLFRAAR